jgi:hypothetical protein
MQTLIVDALQGSRVPLTTAELRKRYELESWDYYKLDWKRRRSVRMSMGRALRQLEAAEEIKRNKAGEWHPAKGWVAREERLAIAYHEAGHAVIGLALKMPIAFVTIKRRAYSSGHVSQAPVHHSIGAVYARGSYSKPIADMSKQDAFGNPVSKHNNDWHADIVMSIAGGMAEAEFVRDGRTWRELASGGDMSSIVFARRKLGDKARSVAKYEAECEKLIKQHWPMIEAVTAKLLKEETLGGDDIYDVCLRTSRNVVRRQHLKGKRKGEGLT